MCILKARTKQRAGSRQSLNGINNFWEQEISWKIPVTPTCSEVKKWGKSSFANFLQFFPQVWHPHLCQCHQGAQDEQNQQRYHNSNNIVTSSPQKCDNNFDKIIKESKDAEKQRIQRARSRTRCFKDCIARQGQICLVMSQGGKIIWPASRPRSQKCRSFRTDLTPFEVNLTVTQTETRIINYETGLKDNCCFSTFDDIGVFQVIK